MKTFGWIRMTVFLCLVTISKTVLAVTCTLDSASVFKTASSVTMPLNLSTISVSNDIPDGTIIYQQKYLPSYASATVNCDNNATWLYVMSLLNVPMPLSSWTGSIISPEDWRGPDSWDGHIYETGVAGIGVTITMMSSRIPAPGIVGTNCAASNKSCTDPGEYARAYIALVKTGPISAGVINAGNLPTFTAALGRQESNILLYTLNFSGAINVTLPTCTTPDFSVSLGQWSTKRFNVKGSSSPWIAANITLTNCGVFSGSNLSSYWSDDNSSDSSTMQWNTWAVSLSPVSSVLDSANGIMSVDTSDPTAATGIGIQLSSGDTTSADSHVIDFSSSLSGTFTADGASSVTIPLSARYIQTEDRVTAGKANGKLVYTVTYF
ncbi:type 1 fimbrial protein [Enterobacter sp. I4]|uniref:Type 1 fimbrial protein n=1 Tax=Enterobacter cloacae TaxID=550 RepID=A0A7H8UJJ6_ENTCL|nr:MULTISPECIES: fimbrial protein [Enterobacter]MCI2294104.1 type 1 fimbrial protein [Enterobacter sp. I4]MDE4081335.1 fimbrial protein [Enterobacter pasteurii]QLA00082.1 type 1 fimbrial protein [Enterobacter cloacae]